MAKWLWWLFSLRGTLPSLARLGYSPGMKRIAAFLVLLLAAGMLTARAQQNADSQYLNLYGAIQQADDLVGFGDLHQALAKYTELKAQLHQFQNAFPNWNPGIVTFRLKYLDDKISWLTAQLPPPSPAIVATNAGPVVPSAADVELNALRAQLEALRSENATLLAKLKEALSVQPALADTAELVTAREKIRSLMKENDLLKAVAAERLAVVAGVTNTPIQKDNETLIHELTQERDGLLVSLGMANKRLADAKKADTAAQVDLLADQIRTLHERLAVDEAQPSPYTSEELALLRHPAPQLVTGKVQKKSVKQLPAGSRGLVAEAESFFAARQYDRAEADYLKILQSDVNNPLVLGNLAAIELQEGKLDDAKKHIQIAVAQDPNDAFNLATLGYLKFKQAKYDEALDALSRAAKLDPGNPEIQNYLGVTLSNKGLRSQAEAALRKAIGLNPNYADAHYNLAVIYIGQTPPLVELARWHYQKSLQSGHPHTPELEKMLAEKSAPDAP